MLQDKNTIKLLHSEIYAGLNHIQNESVDLTITSPPYWMQRDYGFEKQIGNEPDYTEYIGKLLKVFDILKNKLTPKGVFFLNIGDKYLQKYGKSKLLLIPYKLAYLMKENGWILNDILIWYKPNHMPSSVQDRFTNTYEPILVFSKSRDNYYTEYINTARNTPKVLKINLQPTPYPHIAVFPEKLVETLISITSIPPNSTILDPFAGSGTTCKAVMNLNSKLFGKNLSCIMIEPCENYIKIIAERCNLKNASIVSIPYEEYQPYRIEEKPTILNTTTQISQTLPENGFVKITESKDEYINILKTLLNPDTKSKISPTATIYIGYKKPDLDLIYNTAFLNNHGWAIRNIIINNNNNNTYFIFLIVDDNSKYKYVFNLKNVKVPHKTHTKQNRPEITTGMKVINTVSKTRKKGIIQTIIHRYSDMSPKTVEVLWDDKTTTTEIIINENEPTPDGTFLCRNCKTEITTVTKPPYDATCPNCNKKIWDETSVQFVENSIAKNLKLSRHEAATETRTTTASPSQTSRNYSGKFKHINRKNWGSSPGARSSLQEQYLSVKRLFNPIQPVIAKYLNYKCKQEKITRTEVTRKFPEHYIHTVGHWFRTDFGGSIPSPEDWESLKNILNLDDDFTNYACSTCLTLQTVKPSKDGKNPGDYLELDDDKLIEFLSRTLRN